jgi:hypothetical protein
MRSRRLSSRRGLNLTPSLPMFSLAWFLIPVQLHKSRDRCIWKMSENQKHKWFASSLVHATCEQETWRGGRSGDAFPVFAERYVRCFCAVCLGLSGQDELVLSDVIGYSDTGHESSGRRLSAELIHMASDVEIRVEARLTLCQMKCVFTFLPSLRILDWHAIQVGPHFFCHL